MSWINDTGPLGDVVLSSRVRLARNLSDTPFPSIADKSMTDSVIHRVHRSVSGQGSPIRSQYQFLAMGDLAPTDREILVEKHLASPDLLENPERSAILINREEICSIMVNEEDYRMQCIFPGYQLRKALVLKTDDVLRGTAPCL